MIRRRSPLNSVSTRIILCVFIATVVTAVIVSWLSISAIHSDVRVRIADQIRALSDSQSQAFIAIHSAATAQLATAAAPGTVWGDQLLAMSSSTDAVASTGLSKIPTSLLGQFDSLHLHRPNRSLSGPMPDCLSVRIDLIEPESPEAVVLFGCLSRSVTDDLLNPLNQDLGGLRMLIANSDGRITTAASIRNQSRVGSHFAPSNLVDFSTNGELLDYYDPVGDRLVGLLTPLGDTGWILAVEAEYAQVFASAIAITKQIFVVDIWITLLFSVLGYKISLAIMQPINALLTGARRISDGQVEYQIPPPANDDDELGLLTHAFNKMMGKLRNSRIELERDRIRLAEKNEELQRANEILAQLSITDGLTKLHNHRYFQDHLTREIKRVSRTKAPLSLILLDIDDFKLLNDTYGHAAGDDVLVSLASIMNDSARELDLIARYGGEEFVILMPNTDLAGAVHLAEKIRMTVETTRLIIGDGMKPIEITISLGVAPFTGNRRSFFSEADRALYQAKAAGKNCVIIASPASPDGFDSNTL